MPVVFSNLVKVAAHLDCLTIVISLQKYRPRSNIKKKRTYWIAPHTIHISCWGVEVMSIWEKARLDECLSAIQNNEEKAAFDIFSFCSCRVICLVRNLTTWLRRDFDANDTFWRHYFNLLRNEPLKIFPSFIDHSFQVQSRITVGAF